MPKSFHKAIETVIAHPVAGLRYFKCSDCGEIVSSEYDIGGSCHDVRPSAVCAGMTSMYEVDKKEFEEQEATRPKKITEFKPTYEVIAYCACGCGALVFATAIMDGSKDTIIERAIVRLVLDGCRVERVTREE